MQYEEQQRRFAKIKEIVPLLQEWEDIFAAQSEEIVKRAEAIRDAERDPHSNRFATEVRRGKEYLIEFNKKRVAIAGKMHWKRILVCRPREENEVSRWTTKR